VRFVLLGLVAGTLAFPASAGADGSRLPPVAVAATDLADATGAVAPSAAAGHVVFSRQVPSTGRFELVAWSAGRGVRVLPVGDRAVPFDADVGRDALGGAVVSYSRCAVDGTLSYVLPSVDFSAARGCRPFVLDLDDPGARPRPLRLARASGLSLSTPSVRGRSVAAVAVPDRGANVRILFWRDTTQAPVRRAAAPPRSAPSRRVRSLHDPASMRSTSDPDRSRSCGGSPSRRTGRDLVSSCAPRPCIAEDPDGRSRRPRGISVAPAGFGSRSPQARAPVAGSPSCSPSRRARACRPRWPSSGQGRRSSSARAPRAALHSAQPSTTPASSGCAVRRRCEAKSWAPARGPSSRARGQARNAASWSPARCH
jgi:hypothetical protein